MIKNEQAIEVVNYNQQAIEVVHEEAATVVRTTIEATGTSVTTDNNPVSRYAFFV